MGRLFTRCQFTAPVQPVHKPHHSGQGGRPGRTSQSRPCGSFGRGHQQPMAFFASGQWLSPRRCRTRGATDPSAGRHHQPLISAGRTGQSPDLPRSSGHARFGPPVFGAPQASSNPNLSGQCHRKRSPIGPLLDGHGCRPPVHPGRNDR